MKASSWKRITKSDHPDAPEWFEGVADSLNGHLEMITQILSGNTTFGDNLLAEIRQIDLAHDTVTPVELQRLRRTPLGVILVASSYFDYWRAAWRMSETRRMTIEVKVKWDTPPATPPSVIFLVIGA